MNPTKIAHAIFLSTVLLCIPVAIVSQGCGTAPKSAKAKAFLSFRATYDLARGAYLAFQEQVILGKINPLKERLADAGWNTFRTTFKASFRLAMANGDWSQPAPEDLIKAKDEFITLLTSLK